ncbi:MAG: RluA family pseudouridine synthase [Clostridiales Family XIII bacterium]|jgi:23S rRNA pseudouridine1911/1915/1917 synthase|nr:RluA family pseudouridine synthase [Clostridiales Family XIII bacterium]
MSKLYIDSDEHEELRVTFTEAQAGKRLDVALTEATELSRSRVQLLISEGSVLLNGALPDSKKVMVTAGDVASLCFPIRVPLHIEPEEMDLDIRYEDADVIVVNKPQGLVVHPAYGNETGTLVNGLLAHILATGEALSGINGEIRPGIVHRIDKDTSGLLVVAKNDAAHISLSAQLAAHTMTREYVALVSGGFSEDTGTVDRPLGRDPKNRMKRKILPPEQGKRAVTHWEVLERFSSATLIKLRLETGRTHQIRVHMASIGHPVLGDELYGKGKGGQLLHAGKLGFTHPATGQPCEFTSDPPEAFAQQLRHLRLYK